MNSSLNEPSSLQPLLDHSEFATGSQLWAVYVALAARRNLADRPGKSPFIFQYEDDSLEIQGGNSHEQATDWDQWGLSAGA